MTDEKTNENEQAQLRKIIAFQKVVLGIFLKWKWLFLLLFLLLGALFMNYFRVKALTSVSRFEASTRLLFNPRKVAKIESLTEQQLLSILDRPSLKRKIAEHVEMSIEEKKCLSKDVVITQERHPPNLFTLTVASQTENGAAQKANAYAEILIEEYVAYRTTDLENRRVSIAARRKTLLDQLERLDHAVLGGLQVALDLVPALVLHAEDDGQGELGEDDPDEDERDHHRDELVKIRDEQRDAAAF